MSTWPKKLPTLTAEQDRIRDDFMKHSPEVLPQRYSAVESFNDRYLLRELRRRLNSDPPYELKYGRCLFRI